MENQKRRKLLIQNIFITQYFHIYNYFWHPMQNSQNISPINILSHHPQPVSVFVTDPTQVKSTLTSFTIYKLSGSDDLGNFCLTRRYSDFDSMRLFLLKRWPGCFIPPLPRKKLIGKNDGEFIQVRRQGLEYFCKEIGKLHHLWYSDEFQIFIKKEGDLSASLSTLKDENPQDIIAKYSIKLPSLKTKSSDTLIISSAIQFNKYIKKIMPHLANFKLMMESFVSTQKLNWEQYDTLFHQILPEYEKSSLDYYLNLNSEGKMIFSNKNDGKLQNILAKMKQFIKNKNFQQLYEIIDLEERQLHAFLQVYQVHEEYEMRKKESERRKNELEVRLGELNAGKQGFLKGFFRKINIEEEKEKTQKEIQQVKDQIQNLQSLSNLIFVLLGFFEIDRFKKEKMNIYNETLRKIGKIQIQFSVLQQQIFNHILDNDNIF